MTTDQSTMVQEMRDPHAPSDAAIPSQATTKESMKIPVTNNMTGDVEAAASHLRKSIAFLESQDVPNAEMIKTAKGIRDHHAKSGTISQEQFDWLQQIVFSPEETHSGLPDADEKPLQPPATPEEAAKIVAQRKAAIQAEIDKNAPPPGPGGSIQVHPDREMAADVAPSGEEAVAAAEPESVIKEQPADAGEEPQ